MHKTTKITGRKILLGVTCSAILLLSATLGMKALVEAQMKPVLDPPEGYDVLWEDYMIQVGDTVESISREMLIEGETSQFANLREYESLLVNANSCVQYDHIEAGDVIHVPTVHIAE